MKVILWLKFINYSICIAMDWKCYTRSYISCVFRNLKVFKIIYTISVHFFLFVVILLSLFILIWQNLSVMKVWKLFSSLQSLSLVKIILNFTINLIYVRILKYNKTPPFPSYLIVNIQLLVVITPFHIVNYYFIKYLTIHILCSLIFYMFTFLYMYVYLCIYTYIWTLSNCIFKLLIVCNFISFRIITKLKNCWPRNRFFLRVNIQFHKYLIFKHS